MTEKKLPNQEEVSTDSEATAERNRLTELMQENAVLVLVISLISLTAVAGATIGAHELSQLSPEQLENLPTSTSEIITLFNTLVRAIGLYGFIEFVQEGFEMAAEIDSLLSH
jgi:hypothetical protein